MNPDTNVPAAISPDAARAALDSAASAEASVRAHARWMPVYMIAFGLGFGGIAILLGMVDSFAWRMGLFAAIWLVFVVTMVRWASTRPASARRVGRRLVLPWVGTSVLYGVALFVGTGRFQGELAFWLPAAVVIALPLVIGGLRERRS
ncbi:MAG: hypothetical protein M3Y20_00305 [Actinomycetota bacterium]|nr:hypothetical protein [Actinomycetota bacterium]